MKLRSIAAAIGLSAMLTIPLAGCQDGMLKPDARAKLEDASKWAHRGSTTAHALIIGISASCSNNPSKFCTTAMPIVGLADGALALFDKALAVGDTALAAGDASDATLGNALASLIDTEKDVENFIAQIKTQSSEAPAAVRTLIENAYIPPAFSANPLPNG